MNSVSIVIPCGPRHIHVLPRALASVRAQTEPAAIIVIYDPDRRGAGWARNQGLAQVQTEWVIFLDADDELKPSFIEQTHRSYRTYYDQHHTYRYVYTSLIDDAGKLYDAPACPWDRFERPNAPQNEGTWHAVTTLLPTAWARQVGGFDETLAAGEDTDFYLKLVTAGFCGTRVSEPLLIYHRSQGSRSQVFHEDDRRRTFIEQMTTRYKGKQMGCCGDPPPTKDPLTEAAPGLVLARPKWGGKRHEIGAKTGTRYPRADRFSNPIEIDPRDAEARPDLWEVIAPVKKNNPVPVKAPPNGKLEGQANGAFRALAGQLQKAWAPEPAAPSHLQSPPYSAPPPAAPVVPPVSPLANLSRVVRLSRTAYHTTQQPTFVFPAKEYASYTDVRRLVYLSGYDTCTPDEVRAADPSQVYVWLSPEQPPDKLSIKGKAIWWALEYGGEYEPNLTHWQGSGHSVWASDPAWAAAHDAQLVVMGSHEGLKPAEWVGCTPYKTYDYLMLAYQTPRRVALAQQLGRRTAPTNPYPGYGLERHQQVCGSRLMVHAHQSDDVAAIAPQRFALCAAYSLPLVHETVPDPGIYRGSARFADYEDIPDAAADILNDSVFAAVGGRLHDWLCHEHTFAKGIQEALS